MHTEFDIYIIISKYTSKIYIILCMFAGLYQDLSRGRTSRT